MHPHAHMILAHRYTHIPIIKNKIFKNIIRLGMLSSIHRVPGWIPAPNAKIFKPLNFMCGGGE